MKEKFDLSKLNSRLATLIIIIASLGIVAIFVGNMKWMLANYYGFTDLLATLVLCILLLLPFVFVGWVFSWILGRRKKDVDHTRLSIKKGVATIILFFAFIAAFNVPFGNGGVGTVLAKEDLKMYQQGSQYYVEFVGIGTRTEDENITLELSKNQYEDITSIKGPVQIEYKYNDQLPNIYHFVLAKSY